jgi:GT2 family glycosyltransferase
VAVCLGPGGAKRAAAIIVPSVSVVIPCYNYGHLLAQCVRSALSQEAVDVRVLIIDDCSTDGSAERARSVASRDARVRVIEHQTNRGHIATYNEGIAAVDGDYLVILSADDLLAPEALARAIGLMERDQTISFAYGYAVPFRSETALPALRNGPGSARVWDGSAWIAKRCRSGTNIISSPEVVVRTSVQTVVGGYRPDLPHSGDLEMWLRLASHGRVGVITGVDQALYRVHPQSMSRTTFKSTLPELEQRHAAFEAFFDADGAALSGAAELRRQASLAIARRALWRASRDYALPDEEAPIRAAELAALGLRIAPEVTRCPEYRAWTWATGRRDAFCQFRVLATGARTRAELGLYHWNRRRRCV